MKNLRLVAGAMLLAAVCLCAVASLAADLTADVQTTVVSFNIRYGRADDGADSWPYRQEMVCETIAAHDPDIFGLQECLWEQAEVLREAFPQYDFTGMGRDDGRREGEMCAIFTRRARYEVIDRGSFALSETPWIAGSRGWDAALPRIATHVKLRDRLAESDTLYVYNAHFDHVGVEARRQSAKLLRQRVDRYAYDKPVIVMGDFNAPAGGSDPYSVLTRWRLKDTFTGPADSGTFHGFTGEPSRGRIDWILASPELQVAGAGIDRSNRDGRYPSDHFPVWTRFNQERRAAPDLADFIDPFIGTGAHGHTFPGPTLPFGMVQLSPDTRLTGWDGCSGYHADDEVVYGFSHTHLSGTGASDYGDILLMPFTGPRFWQNGYPDRVDEGYGSRFDKTRERAEAGYYSTSLTDTGIRVELTATPRTGLHRYRFPAGQSAFVMVDLEHRDELTGVDLRVLDERTLVGMRRSHRWADDQWIYFRAVFSQPFTSEMKDGPGRLADEHSKAILRFGDLKGEDLLVQVAISAVDGEGARRNLMEEWADFDFEATRQAAHEAWSRELAPYGADGASAADLTTLATALYHAHIAPNLFSDVDGRYRGMDQKIHTAENRAQYTVFSLWDTYRATHPLFTLMQRARTRDFAATAMAQFRQGGRLPVWELAANETDCMIGYHSVSFLADAWLKGLLPAMSAGDLLEAMLDSANRDHFGLDAYRRDGFIAIDQASQSVSRTLEYAYDDACIARLARTAGRDDTAREFGGRAQAWRHLFDPETGFFRPRRNGQWMTPYDPRQVDSHHTEANGWQYRFAAPQHFPQYMELMRGDAPTSAALDAMFSATSEHTGHAPPDITGRIGQYAHGNEPSHHVAWLYHFTGEPQKSADRIGGILRDLYDSRPDGLSGNEDCGQMSAWYVLSAYGLYDVAPTSQQWLIIPPLHERMSLTFEDGKVFTTRRVGEGAVESVTFRGWPLERSWLSHDEVTGGGELIFYLGKGSTWGRAADARPGTEPVREPIVPAPWAEVPGDVFREPVEVTLHDLDPATEIRWTTEPDADPAQGRLYEKPLRFESSAQLRFVALRGDESSPVVTLRLQHVDPSWSLRLGSEPHERYAAGGADLLLDGRRGPDDWRTGGWLGFEGRDFEAVLDLGRPMRVRAVTAGFLQDIGSWIFLPRELRVEVSTDGETWAEAGRAGHDLSDRAEGRQRRDLSVRLDGAPVRFVRLQAIGYGPAPDWHQGAGGDTYLFVDELQIETE